jgi:hypothetical protein
MKGLKGTKHLSLARPPRRGRVTGGDLNWPQRHYVAELQRISPKPENNPCNASSISSPWIGVIGVGNAGLADKYVRRARLQSAQVLIPSN